jgi:protein TonB
MLKWVFITILILASACLFSNHAYSQKNEDKFYVFDVNWKPVAIQKATFLVRIRKLNDTSYSELTYIMFGPRISHETYMDEQATIRHGKCIYYHPTGFRDSAGAFVRGSINGEWDYWNQEGKHVRKKTFDNGVLVSDSLTPVKNDTSTSKSGLVKVDIESSFAGGPGGWMRFLNKNFAYPQRAIGSKIQGTVQTQFVVDKDGTILEPEIIKSVEYSLDEETLRIIHISPKWVPATIDGKPVKSYKLQPITYLLER